MVSALLVFAPVMLLKTAPQGGCIGGVANDDFEMKAVDESEEEGEDPAEPVKAEESKPAEGGGGWFSSLW